MFIPFGCGLCVDINFQFSQIHTRNRRQKFWVIWGSMFNVQTFSKWLQITFPQNIQFFTFLPTLLFSIVLFFYTYPSRYEILSHCSFDLHFLMAIWCWADFHVFIAIWISSLEKYSNLCPFFNWVIYCFVVMFRYQFSE